MPGAGTPSVVVLAGPNGAGKSTVAPVLLQGALGVAEFVDADVIARGLSAFHPEAVALAAGRLMVRRLRELARQRVSFAFETTLASRSFAPWLTGLMASGYSFHLVFLWLPSADFAVERVANRVLMGGHHVPADTVRRRYRAGLHNFFTLYQPLATTWRVYDNSISPLPKLIAAGRGPETTQVEDRAAWEQVSAGSWH